MKLIFSIITLLNTIWVLSQNTIILDSLEKSTLPFTLIQYENNGFYTDSLGQFNKTVLPNNAVLTIKYLGYNTKNIAVNVLPDTVYLQAIATALAPVIINSKNTNTFLEFATKGNMITKFPLNIGNTISTTLNNINNNDETITLNQFSFAIEKPFASNKKGFKPSKDHFKIKYRLSFIDNANEALIYSVLEEKTLINDKTDINHNLKDKAIYFGKKGIKIAIEIIEISNLTSSTNQENEYVIISLSQEVNDGWEAVSFLQYGFDKTKGIVPLNTIFKNTYQGKKEIKRTMAFKLGYSVIEN